MYEAKGMFIYKKEGTKLFAICYSREDAARIVRELKALRAIKARIDGELDNPELKEMSLLSADALEDISVIVNAALA